MDLTVGAEYNLRAKSDDTEDSRVQTPPLELDRHDPGFDSVD